MPLLILGALLAILVYVPAFWVRQVMSRYGKEVPDLPGTGGELAEHLIERFKLDGIGVEETAPLRDHFDPEAKMVRLSPENYNGKSRSQITPSSNLTSEFQS